MKPKTLSVSATNLASFGQRDGFDMHTIIAARLAAQAGVESLPSETMVRNDFGPRDWPIVCPSLDRLPGKVAAPDEQDGSSLPTYLRAFTRRRPVNEKLSKLVSLRKVSKYRPET